MYTGGLPQWQVTFSLHFWEFRNGLPHVERLPYSLDSGTGYYHVYVFCRYGCFVGHCVGGHYSDRFPYYRRLAQWLQQPVPLARQCELSPSTSFSAHNVDCVLSKGFTVLPYGSTGRPTRTKQPRSSRSALSWTI